MLLDSARRRRVWPDASPFEQIPNEHDAITANKTMRLMPLDAYRGLVIRDFVILMNSKRRLAGCTICAASGHNMRLLAEHQYVSGKCAACVKLNPLKLFVIEQGKAGTYESEVEQGRP